METVTDEILGMEIESCEMAWRAPFVKYGVKESGLCLSFMTEIASGNGPLRVQKMRNPAGDFDRSDNLAFLISS